MSTKRFAILCIVVLLSACASTPLQPMSAHTPPCRFLLTFDDGPSASRDNNTTLAVLKQLETNDVQPRIKALFFVQTRNPDGGGNEYGKAVLRYEHAAGHVLGLHSGTARGHIRHTTMSSAELAQSLIDGKADLRAITGHDPVLIRPTFWGYNNRTRELYASLNLRMLLTDVNNRDGWPLHSVFGLRERVHNELLHVRHAIEHGDLSHIHTPIPVIITLHDLNTFTSRRVSEYLHMLVEEAQRVGLPLAAKPFFDDAAEIVEAALQRTTPPEPETLTAEYSGQSLPSNQTRVRYNQLAHDSAHIIPVRPADATTFRHVD